MEILLPHGAGLYNGAKAVGLTFLVLPRGPTLNLKTPNSNSTQIKHYTSNHKRKTFKPLIS